MQSSRRRKTKAGGSAKSTESTAERTKVPSASGSTTSTTSKTSSKTTGSKTAPSKTTASKAASSKTAGSGSSSAKTSSSKTNGAPTPAKRKSSASAASKKTSSAESTAVSSAAREKARIAKDAGTKAAASKTVENSPSETAPSGAASSPASAKDSTVSDSQAVESVPEAASASESASTSSIASTALSDAPETALKTTGSADEQDAADDGVTEPATEQDASEDVRETHPGVYTSSGYQDSTGRAEPETESVTPDTTDVVESATGVEAADDPDDLAASSTIETAPDASSETDADASEGSAGGVESDENVSGGVESIADTEFGEIDVDLIDANPRQPRTVFDEDLLSELVHSIREIGVLQPVVVRQKPSDRSRFELIMGERRLRATKDAGLTTIPAIIRYVEDTDMLRDALLENLHRAELNPLEEAAAYGQLLEDFGCTQEELSERIGRSRPQISNTLRLLRLPPLVQRRVAAGVISGGHARAILGLRDPEHMEVLAQRIVAEGLSVRASEEAVVLLNRGDSINVSRATTKVAPEFLAVAERLGDRLDTKVNISVGKKKGKLSVEFANHEDLDRILGLLGIAEADPM
nr:ParB/RepB/Spo0J family partition protein [Brevibacterium renqingii]